MWVKSESFIKRGINKALGRLRLLTDYVNETPVRVLFDYRDDLEKSILAYYLEKAIDQLLVYGFAGLAINYALKSLFSIQMSFPTIIGWGIAYWFLIRILRILVFKER